MICSDIKALGFHCFLSSSCRDTVGARLRGVGGRKVTGNTDADCLSNETQVPSAFSWQESSRTRLTNETAWLQAARDTESDHSKKNRVVIYIEITYSSHSALWGRGILTCQNVLPVSPNQWIASKGGVPTAVWVSSSFLLKRITLFFS